MKKKKLLTISYFILLIIIAFILILINLYPEKQSPISPDESQLIFFNNNFQETSSIFWDSKLNTEFDSKNFIRRGTLEIKPNLYTSIISPQYLIIFSIINSFIPLNLITTFFALIGILFAILLFRIFLKENTSLIGGILVLLLPPYIFFSGLQVDIIPAISFLIGSFYYLLKFNKSTNQIDLYLGLLLFLISSLIRIHNAIFFPIFLGVIIFKYKAIIKKIKFSKIIFFFLIVLALFLINYHAYGSIFSSGRALVGEIEEEKTIMSKIFQYGINQENIFESMGNYFFNYVPILILIGFFGMIQLWKKSQKSTNKYLLISLAGICLFLVIYFGSNNTFYNFYEGTIHSSLSRYFIPIYFFLTFLTLFKLESMNKNKLKLFLLFAIIISLALFIINDPSWEKVEKNKELSLEINNWAATLEKESIFFVKTNGKYVINSGKTYLIYSEKDLIEHPSIGEFYPLLKNSRETIKIIENLYEKDYDLYLTKEENIIFDQLKIEGWNLIEANKLFYKIEK